MFKISFELIGGLCLFIYGIQLMGDGLKQTASNKIRSLLSKITRNRIVAVLIGFIITALVQSSSAVTVILVGFVNAGLLSFTSTIGVIMGSNIGTTVTAQLIAFKLTKFAFPSIALGFILNFFTKKYKNIGNSILGFGLLFLGLNIMSTSMKFFRNHHILNIILEYCGNSNYYILFGILVGTIITAIIQSSSASTGLIIALSMSNTITLKASLPIILGCNLGTCVTALIASIGTNSQAKRTAIAHIIFNVIGILIFIPILRPFEQVVIMLSNPDISRHIANAHTIFNITTVMMLLPFTSYFSRFICKIVPEKIEVCSCHLDRRLLDNPALAMIQVNKEILRMLGISKTMLKISINSILNNENKCLSKVYDKEEIVDILQKEITHYLVDLSENEFNQNIAEEIYMSMRMVNEIEKISDHAENLAKLSKRKSRDEIKFDSISNTIIETQFQNVYKFYKNIIKSFKCKDKKLVKDSLFLEDEINKMNKDSRNNCVKRFKKENIKHGLIFVDILHQLEKIGDHIFNIAELQLGIK